MKSKKPAPYDPKKIEPKWQKNWLAKKTFVASNTSKLKKKFVLVEFPYPSGAGLHMGHMRPFVAGDVTSKFFKMKGFNTMYPMGWDAFGLPAENFAIKNKVHPRVSTAKNVANAKKQLISWGTGFDWSREVNTTDPEYYKWTQKLFLEFYKSGLAFESTGLINWCPKDKTGLANEEVIDGKCDRCGEVVEKKNLRQWYLKITDYADKLLEGLKNLPEWPHAVKVQQENWIGRSEGVNLKCKINDINMDIQMYDSIPQTFYAQTFAVIGPDHKLLTEIVKGVSNESEVLAFAENIVKKKNAGGFDHLNSMEGIFTGRYIHYPAGNRDIPLWVASYAVSDYGTGIVSCSAHDERDFAFAKKFNIPLKTVLYPENNEELKQKIKNHEVFYREPDGVLEEPERFKGRKWHEVRQDVINYLVENNFADRKINYKLRDWVFSRQRYWGEPIPLIHCPKCGTVEVPEKDLPVKLPEVKNYEPTGTGESPLAAIDKWVNVKCPKCVEESKKTKYLVFDFDGVIGDTLDATLKSYLEVGLAKNMDEAKVVLRDWFEHKLEYLEGEISDETRKSKIKRCIAFGEVMKKQDFKIFTGFVSEIKKIKNAKIAFISSGSSSYVLPAIKSTGLKYTHCITGEIGISKLEEIKKICKAWKIELGDVYYFTDANSDYYQLAKDLDNSKLIGCAWGFLGEEKLLKVFKQNQILKNFKDIHNLFKVCDAKRETNTMPQWAGSSWYWLRYMDAKNKKEFADKKIQKYWSPVDLYFGGMEHTTLHLLYSRFWNLAFYDRGLVAVKEPYNKRVPHGIILGPDGEKMSKSRGNVVNPDDVIKIYGADTTRLYMMFLGPHGAQVAWNDKGIIGTRRFLERVWAMREMVSTKENEDVTITLHKTIKKVGEDIETFSFNTAVSTMMIFVNTVYESKGITKKSFETFLQILAPFAPHMTEELWNMTGNKKSIYESKWPSYKESLLKSEKVTVVVQVNGKIKAEISIDRDIDDETAKRHALENQKVTDSLNAQEIKRVIVVKNRLINIVI